MSSRSTLTAERTARAPVVSITACRGCGRSGLTDLIDFGEHPLANGLLPFADAPEDRYPLRLARCDGCSLVQIRETVDKSILFSRYVWLTGTSSTARAFAKKFRDNVLQLRPVQKGSLVIEVASNDGTFLEPWREMGIDAIGVDPAGNIAAMANERGIPTINAFWDRAVAEELVSRRGLAQVVYARNVVPHASELEEVIGGMKAALAEGGVGAIEFHYAGEILEGLQYDAIYHEHLCYFSIRSLERLLARFDLPVFHVDPSPISGGAMVVYFSKERREPSDGYRRIAAREDARGVNGLPAWREFAAACARHREFSRGLLASFSGRRVIGFGASARSSTYLNYCGFTARDIAAIADNNRLKQGRWTPGSRIPVVSRKEGLEMKPDLLFLLAWNFKDEAVDLFRGAGYRGPFLLPFPRRPHLVPPLSEANAFGGLR